MFLFTINISMSFTNNRSSSRFLDKKTKTTQFLNEMNMILPRNDMITLIEQFHTRWKPELWGRPRIATETMLRMYFLSLWFNLSDQGTEEAIYDRLAFQYFMNIDITIDHVPDATTLGDFRLFLEKHTIWVLLLDIVNRQLEQANLSLSEWKLIDATIIKAPSSTKNNQRRRDPDMSSTKKWWNYHFGAKVHIATDTQWIIQDIEVTTAHTPDNQVFKQFLTETTQYTITDAWYTGKRLQEIAKEKWVQHLSMKKRNKWQKSLSITDRIWNTLLAMPRKIVEFPFGVIKHLRWHKKTRYKWLYKLKHQWYVLSALCNMYRMRRKYMLRRKHVAVF